MTLAAILATFDVTITGRTAGALDSHGNRLADTSAPVDVTGWFTRDASIEGAATSSPTITDTATLLLDPTVAIDAGDAVTVDGATWEVDGDPLASRTPRGAVVTVVALKRTA